MSNSRKRCLNAEDLSVAASSPSNLGPQAKRTRLQGQDESKGVVGHLRDVSHAMGHAISTVMGWTGFSTLFYGSPKKQNNPSDPNMERNRREKEVSMVYDSRDQGRPEVALYGHQADLGGEVTYLGQRKASSVGIQTASGQFPQDDDDDDLEVLRDDVGALAAFAGFTPALNLPGVNVKVKGSDRASRGERRTLGIVEKVKANKMSARTFSAKSPMKSAKDRFAPWPRKGAPQDPDAPNRGRAQRRAYAKDFVYRSNEKSTYKRLLERNREGHFGHMKWANFFACQEQSPFFKRQSVLAPAIDVTYSSSKKSSGIRERLKSSASSGHGSPAKAPEVIDLSGDESSVKAKKPTSPEIQLWSRPRSRTRDDDIEEVLNKYVPRPELVDLADLSGATGGSKVKPFNSLEADLKKKAVYSPEFVNDITKKYNRRARERDIQVARETEKVEYLGEKREELDKAIGERMRKYLSITEVPLELEDSEEEGEEELPEITDEMEAVIARAQGSRGETLIDKFNIAITRKDIDTLRGLNWLNDEVINFYMSLICERSKTVDNWPNVYAFNTFFYPKIMKIGHSAVKRWTRKVDLFAHDLLLIPVHLGMHWCLATIDLENKAVYYYDSMLGNNEACLKALLKYLQDEHLDKKKSEFDVSGFTAECVKNIPQQMNGSDCGMFTCKFAEYLSRRAAITFDQEDMPYFRKRMIYEVASGDLLHP